MHREECINYDPNECEGPVEWWWPGTGQTQWPRCTFHGKQRQANVSELERWADSDLPPPWFDPSLAGERWNSED